jgi:nucleotide-binding universal stress UspA family protein
MGYKTILVPLDSGDLNESLLRTALAAAQHFKAHIEVLYVPPSRRDDVVRYGTVGMSDSLRKAVMEAAERGTSEQAAAVRKAFEKFCRDNNVTIAEKPPAPEKATAAFREEASRGADALVRRGRLSDLIFVPRPGDSTAAAETFETALLETGRPVVIAPPTPPHGVATRITIGWNASAEAARAVGEALPCLASADAVTVLASEKRRASAQELAEYLGWNGIKPTVRIFDAGSRSVGETLLAESRELGADLLVIGGYTRTRARQLLFGGVTRHIFEAADIPVMLAH